MAHRTRENAMFYKFQYRNELRAGMAIQENHVLTVGGIDRHTFRIECGLLHMYASECEAVTEREFRNIENAHKAETNARLHEHRARIEAGLA